MKSLLKFITCGSVDDGKSTLIGRMLYDAKLLFADQEKALELDSKLGSRAGKLDYSLLLDGLMAEREQGITIDLAYRYFNTENRSFIVADTPGHEEYTRNMAVGASFADLSVILVDASKGILSQTKRHARISALMGIKHFVLAVNKIDLVHYSEDVFEKIKSEFIEIIKDFKLETIQIIPLSATEGDNIIKNSRNTPWYSGLALLPYLENIDISINKDLTKQGFVLPIQRVTRPDHLFRGFQGQVESGKINLDDEITILPSGEKAKVKSIYVTDKESTYASAGQAVTLQLDREVDVSRGCVLAKDKELEHFDMFAARIIWMDDADLVAGRNYLIKIGTKMLPAIVMSIEYKIDVNTGAKIWTDKIKRNEIAKCHISLSEKIIFDQFENGVALGGLILIDRITNMTSACGIIEGSLESVMSSNKKEIKSARQVIGEKPFLEIHLNTCYEESTRLEISIDISKTSLEDVVEIIVKKIM